MAIAALVLWTLTVALGVYLLITSTRVTRDPETLDDARDSVTAGASAVGGAPAAARVVRPAARPKDRFDPPSLREAKDEPMPGLRALAEFTHPALAVTGFGFWVAYTLVRDDIFGVIGFGVMLGAIAAGISWALTNGRAAKRGDTDALAFSPRVLIFHIAGAAITLLLAALITAKV
ncbi:MAG TPA: hypothetical protein VK817_13695 [Trebonia sp.]|nr:hypothetical protein [Trebonia sp.]